MASRVSFAAGDRRCNPHGLIKDAFASYVQHERLASEADIRKARDGLLSLVRQLKQPLIMTVETKAEPA